MISTNRYKSRFTNRYGEQWEFEFDVATAEGTLRGSDVDWEAYRVEDGNAIGLILNDEEVQGLRKAWAEATGGG